VVQDRADAVQTHHAFHPQKIGWLIISVGHVRGILFPLMNGAVLAWMRTSGNPADLPGTWVKNAVKRTTMLIDQLLFRLYGCRRVEMHGTPCAGPARQGFELCSRTALTERGRGENGDGWTEQFAGVGICNTGMRVPTSLPPPAMNTVAQGQSARYSLSGLLQSLAEPGATTQRRAWQAGRQSRFQVTRSCAEDQRRAVVADLVLRYVRRGCITPRARSRQRQGRERGAVPRAITTALEYKQVNAGDLAGTFGEPGNGASRTASYREHGIGRRARRRR